MQLAFDSARKAPCLGPWAVALACCAFAGLTSAAATTPGSPASGASRAVRATGTNDASPPELLQAPARAGGRVSASALAAAAHCKAALPRHPLELRLEPALQPEQFDMQVRFFAPVPTQIAWQAMTDYGAMASFMPGMDRSEVIAADGDSLRVLQIGRGGVEPFRVTLSSTLDITLRGHVATWFTTQGNLDSQGRAEVHARVAGSMVEYTARLHPRVWLPPLIGTWFMRQQLRQQMTALRERMCVLQGERTVAEATKPRAEAAATPSPGDSAAAR